MTLSQCPPPSKNYPRHITSGTQSFTKLTSLSSIRHGKSSTGLYAVMVGLKYIVKHHPELRNSTELQLDRVGVDFVFPPSQLTTKNNPRQNQPEGSVLQTWNLAHRLNSQN